jgi:hypothetical protein
VFLLISALIAAVTIGVGCAETNVCPEGLRLIEGQCVSDPPPCTGSVSKFIEVGCELEPQVTVTGEPAPLRWELTVAPQPIAASAEFASSFSGRIAVGATTFNDGLALLSTGFRRVVVSNAEARVQVRRGATLKEGEQEPVLVAAIQETCTYDETGRTDPDVTSFPACDPANNTGAPDPRGLFANTDCTGLGGSPDPLNPCLPYVSFPTSDDCEEGGACAELGQTLPGGPCEKHGFCAVGGAEVPIGPSSGTYLADSAGTVLFGFAEDLPIVEVGPLRGAYDFPDPPRGFGMDVGLSGFDVLVAGLPIAWECVMGVTSLGPDGVDTIEVGVSPSPDALLLSCPIE